MGEVDFLTRPISVFIRIGKSVKLGDLTEVVLPTMARTHTRKLAVQLEQVFQMRYSMRLHTNQELKNIL